MYYQPDDVWQLFNDNGWTDKEWEVGWKGCSNKVSFEYGLDLIEIWCSTGTIATTVYHDKWKATKRH